MVPLATPRIGASRSPVVRPISHHPSLHARTPRVDHSSANCCRYADARRGIAPSEWLTRYVQVSTIGNSDRIATIATIARITGETQRIQFRRLWQFRRFWQSQVQIDPDTLHLRVVLECV